MSSSKPSKLSNYLRANRRRLSLSQDEVSYLLGAESGAKVCRYERFIRAPSLETALAYEAIFQKPVSEIFPGLYQRVEKQVALRAEALISKSCSRKPSQQHMRKRQALAQIAARPSNKSHKSK
jgi:transcriptional regulator with XRE-family HTH domain